MRLPVDAGHRLFAIGLTAALASCGVIGGGDRAMSAQAEALAVTGPAADYPMVLGEPFTVDGEVYTPADTLNYDAVGMAGVDDGAGVSAAHRTLPLPSYAEVTSLESGKTILVRVERRGPMTGKDLVTLSPAAAAQLGAEAALPVRVRRVNPPEAERAELRGGRTVPERMETPKSLVEVLRRKLPAGGAVTLAGAAPVPSVSPTRQGQPVLAASPAAAPAPSVAAAATAPHAVTAYPLPAVAAAQTAPGRPSATAEHAGKFAVQAGAFASKVNADRAASSLGGFVSPSGRLFLVRTGPFATRKEADAALAKVRAAGYSDARVTTAS